MQEPGTFIVPRGTIEYFLTQKFIIQLILANIKRRKINNPASDKIDAGVFHVSDE